MQVCIYFIYILMCMFIYRIIKWEQNIEIWYDNTLIQAYTWMEFVVLYLRIWDSSSYLQIHVSSIPFGQICASEKNRVQLRASCQKQSSQPCLRTKGKKFWRCVLMAACYFGGIKIFVEFMGCCVNVSVKFPKGKSFDYYVLKGKSFEDLF